MTTYAWPTGSAWVPASAELRVVDNLQRVHESSLSGYAQTQSMPGARWGWGYDMAPQSSAQRQALEGYLLRLSGREHRVSLWDHKQPRPRGNITLSGVTLGASAAQFATTLQLAGCVNAAGQSLAGFEADADADGLADGCVAYAMGTTGTVTYMRSTSPLVEGAFTQTVNVTGVGTTAGDRAGFDFLFAGALSGASQAVTAAVWVRGTVGVRATILMQALNAAGTVVDSAATTITMSLTFQDVAVTSTVPSGAVSVRVYCYLGDSTIGVAAAFADFDALQVDAGSSRGAWQGRPTLLAGDWLGLTGGQLVRVVADAAANDAGAMTVEVRHMLRNAVASASAVTLNKPTALYVRTESGLAMPRMPGFAEPGMGLEFVEVFA